MNAPRKIFLSPMAITLISASAWGADFAPKAPDSPLDLDRPALAWAMPGDGPPIRGLVITPWTASRDAYVVAQHMPFEFEIVETRDGDQINFDDDTMGRTDHPEFAHTTERLEKLLEKRYDVIVLAAFNFGSLPAEIKYEVLKQAVEGAGLVLANQDWKKLGKLHDPLFKNAATDDAWQAAVPWDAFLSEESDVVHAYPGVRFRDTKTTVTPQFSDRNDFLNVVRRYYLKKGRLALLDYGRQSTARRGTGLSPAFQYPPDRLIQHEDYISIAAKQIRWAAKRDPEAAISDVQPNAISLDRGELAAAGRVTIVTHKEKPAGYRLRCVIRDVYGDVEWQQESDLQIRGERTEIPVRLPALKTGEHFLNVWVLREGKVLDWGSGRFTVTSDVGIDRVELDRDRIKSGEPVSGIVKFKGGLAGGTCRLRVIDSYDRLEIAEGIALAPGQRDCPFRLSLPDPVGIIFRVEAWLEQDAEVISEGKAEFTIPKQSTENRFYGILWGGGHGPGPIADLVFREARRYGYDASLSAYPAEYMVRAAAKADLAVVPYMIRLFSCDGDKYCFTSPEWRKEMAEGLSAHAAMVSKYGALGYSLGDEVRLERTICESPTCQKAFRDYLRNVYGTVDALNRKWHSDFKTLDQIRPGYVEEARKGKNFVPWMDYQMHRRDLWVDACRWCADAIHRGDPGARMGYEGAPGFERWPELLEFFRITGPYDRFDNDIVVDERRPGSIIGNWIGSYGANVEDSWIRYMSWRRLLLGFNSQWWWTQMLGFNGDGTPVRRFAANVDAFAELNSGLDTLLFSGTSAHDPIAIPYCAASELASEIYSEQTSIQGAKDAARAIVHDLSLHHWRIPMKKIAEGEMEKRGVRIVFLPYHQAMSREEAAGLQRFVEQGGTIVADLRPVVMDEHGDPLREGFLDAVFGIRRKEPGVSETVRDAPNGRGAVEAIQKSGLLLTADAAVELREGQALGMVGRAPIVIEHKFGKGRAILLNFALDDYLTARENESHRSLQALFSRMFEESGVTPAVRVTASGKPLDGLWLARWTIGPMLVAGVDRWPISPARDEPLTARLQWPDSGEVYDVRAGKHLGKQKETDIQLAVHEPHLLAWLPYRIGPLSVDAPQSAGPGSRLAVAVKLEGVSGPHVVCLDVFGPDGARCVYFRRRLLLENGQGQTSFALALNAAPGQWRIRAREVISGQTVWHEVKVESP